MDDLFVKQVEEIFNLSKNITNNTPMLLIDKARDIFKTLYTGNINYISNTEEARELIQNYSGITLEKPLVIDDVSNLYRDTILLKFLEETKLKLILLASQDNLDPIILSRVKTIKKYTSETNLKYEPIDILQAQKTIESEELDQENTLKYLSNKCPELIILNKKLRYIKNKNKLIELIGRISIQ